MVNDLIASVKDFGECFVLKMRLLQFRRALDSLIDELQDRAVEARAEKDPSEVASEYFRDRFDDAIHRFWCIVGLPENPPALSATRIVYDLSDNFSLHLMDLLPRQGRCKLNAAATSPITYVWRDQLDKAAAAADTLALELRGQAAVLRAELLEKELLAKSMGDAVQRLRKVL